MKNRLRPRLYGLILMALFLVMSFGMALPVRALTFDVDTTDGGPSDSECAIDCSLADAVDLASNTGINPGHDDIIFNALGPGPHVINLTAPLVITEEVTIDGATLGVGGSCPGSNAQPTPMIIIQNSGVSTSAITVQNGSSVIRGLVIDGFNSAGAAAINLDGSSNNTIECNFLGVNQTGTTAVSPNAFGIVVSASSTNTLRNNTIVSTNTGISISGASSGNTVRQSKIGTSADGENALGPLGSTGIIITGAATSNEIGIAGQGNVISGNNDAGIKLSGGTASNTVSGNFIGTNGDGTNQVPNKFGVVINTGATNNLIGGAGGQNIISANLDLGVYINAANNNVVTNNIVGLSSGGLIPFGNGLGGIMIEDASNNGIGAPSNINYISGNTAPGIVLKGTSTANTIIYNQIGLSVAGFDAVPNPTGIMVIADGNTMANNVVSGNTNAGIYVVGNNNTIQNNNIGPDSGGGSGVGNANGIVLEGDNNLVDTNNTIAFNSANGVLVQSTGTGNTIRGNSIHDNASKGIALSAGANNNQKSPTLFHVTDSLNGVANTPNINYDLVGFAPNTTYTIDFYMNSTTDCEGETYLTGSDSVTTDGSGNVTNHNYTGISGAQVGAMNLMYFSATATDPAGNTSEFTPVCEQEQNAPSFQFTPTTLPAGYLNIAYDQLLTLNTTSLNGGITASLFAGTLPGGITFNAVSPYHIAGTSTVDTGTFTFTLRMQDAARFYGDQDFTLDIRATLPTIVVAPNGANPTVLPGGQAGVPYSQTFTASAAVGDNPPYTFSVTAGSLPPGVALDAPVSVTGNLVGTPTASGGPFVFTITATDAGGATGSQQYSLTIAAPPALIITTTSLPDTYQGLAAGYTQPINFTGGVPPYSVCISAGTFPSSGLVSVPAVSASCASPTALGTGVTSIQINGGGAGNVPNGNGAVNFTLQLIDSLGTITTQLYNFTVNPTPVLSFNPLTLPSTIQGLAGYNSGAVTAINGSTGSTYTLALTPAGSTALTACGLTFNNTTPTFSITGTATCTPSVSFDVVATDGNGFTNTVNFTITVNGPPTITLTAPPIASTYETLAYSQTITAGGTGTAPYSFMVTVGSLPPGMTLLDATPDADVVISGTAGAGSAAGSPYNFTIQATDANGFTGSQAYSLTVNAAPNLTLTTNPNPLEGRVVGANYNATFTPGGSAGPFNVTLEPGDTLATTGLVYIPGAVGSINNASTAAGTSTFTLRVTDTALGFSKTFPYSITIANVALSTTTLPVVSQGVTYSPLQVINVTGGDGTYALSASVPLNPASGMTLTIGTNSFTISGTGGTPGNYNFTLDIDDGNGGIISQPYTLVVSDIVLSALANTTTYQAIPAGYNEPINITGGTGPYTVCITGGALPAAGLTSSLGAISTSCASPTAVTGGTFNIIGAGAGNSPNASGTANFTIQVTDSLGGIATRSYSVVVNATPTLTLTSNPNPLQGRAVGVNYSATFTPAGSPGPFNVTLEPGDTLAATGLVYIPGAVGSINNATTAAGVSAFTLRVTDTALGFTQTFPYTIVIANVTISPTVVPMGMTGNTYGPFSVVVTGGDGTYSLSIPTPINPASGLTITPGTNDFTISGTAGTASTYTFDLAADDGNGGTVTQSYSLQIQPVALGLSALAQTVTYEAAPNGYNQPINITGGTGPYTVCITGGALPAAGLTSSLGAISTNCASPTAVTGSTFNIIGAGASNVPNANGTASFDIQVNDSLGGVGTRSYSVTVNTTPTLTLTSNPNPLEGRAVGANYSATFTPGGSTGVFNVTLEPGGTLGTVGLNFIPGAVGAINNASTAAGTPTFTLRVTDTTYGFTQTFPYTFTIANVTLSPTSLPGGTVNVAYNQVINVAGGDGTYTLTTPVALSAASGLTVTLGANTFTIAGTPPVGSGGTYNFTLAANDGNGGTVSQAYSIVITAPTVAITATIGGSTVTALTGTENFPIPVTFSAAGGVGAHTITGITITPALTGVTPAGIGTNAGTLNGSPASGTAATYSVQVTAADSVGNTATRTYSLTITPPGLITITPTTINGTVGTALTQALTAVNGTAPYTFSLFSGTLPAGLTLSAAGVISGTPTVATTGTVTVRATDVNSTNGNTVISFNIQPPTIVITPAALPNAAINTPYSVTLNATGGTGPYTFTYTPAGSLPPGITLTAAGVLSGTPTTIADYPFGVIATDSLGNTGTIVYTLSVKAVPSLNLLPATLPNGTQGVPYTQTLSASGGTPAYTFTITQGALPTGLTLNSSTGVISGTPTVALGFIFTVRVTDTSTPQRSAVVTYSVSIIGANAPVFASIPSPGTEITFGIVPAGSSVQRSIVIGELGGSPLIVTLPPGGGFGGANPGSFAIIGGNPPFTINDGGAPVTMTISCAPTSSLGVMLGTLTLNTNDPIRPIVTYYLKCNDNTPPITGTTTPGAPGGIPTEIAPGVSVITVLTAQPDGVTTQAGEIGRVITVRGLALRSGPYLGATMLGIIRPKKDYVVLAQNNGDGGDEFNWYLVVDKDNDRVGWASGRYMTVTNPAKIPFQNTIFDQIDNTRDVGARVITFGNVNIRPRPSLRMKPLMVTPYGAEMAVLGRTIQAGEMQWLHVMYNTEDGKTVYGWIYWAFDSPDLVKAKGVAPLDAVPIR